MNRPARTASRIVFLALGGAVALAMLAVATPLMAVETDVAGWFAALDLAQTQPNSLDEQYAIEVDFGTGNARRQVLDNETHLTWRAGAGYSFGKGLGGLQVSYWKFDNDESLTKTFAGVVYPSLFGYGGTSGYIRLTPPPTEVTATSNVKAQTIDVDYVRPLVIGDVLTVKWLTGLRSATFEEDRGFEAIDNTTTYLVVQTRHLKTTAAGIRFGVGAVFGFSKHFSLESGLTVSFLQAKVDADAFQNEGGTVDTLEGSNDNVRGEIRDYDARAVWSYGPVQYYLGYGGSTWDGLVADPISGTDGFEVVAQRSRDSISFNSVHAGVVWRFGNP